ncbi:MAG: T9SS type A sorting domain-containing protein [Flavobacteriaceae bacterium]|nr:endonuclease [Bacteroidia bacterium]NNL16746.1 T9SS type A sorting domain-containing protein [Flavobacteriaceae bacterium]
MKRIFTSICFLLLFQLITGQIVINELDSDTDGVDDMEFVELKSDAPNFSLDGYVVVFFNGSDSGGNSSYLAIDLDGYVTDVNGLLLIGSTTVSPFPQLIIAANRIQNGADAVAVYQADATDFPEGTLATHTNLIDALMYDTSDADDLDLMALLGETVQINENENGNKDTESIQLNNDEITYTVTTPTPRQLNDGSGVVLNGITISVAQTQYNEGDVFDITFTSETNVTEDLGLTFSLNNGGFNTADFTGSTSVTIPNGSNTISTTITLVDDTDDEGDEVLEITLAALPASYIALNNDIEIRVVDNDFVVATWGIPTSPTFGSVTSTQPSGYYNSLDGLADINLRQALQDIIADPNTVRAQTYSDIIDILKEADQNPANSNQVWLVYTEEGRAKLDFQTTSNSDGKWNREHTFPRSLGGYNSIDLDDIADGINNYWITEADSLRHANSDAHGLRAADGPENSSRGNQHYGQYNGPSGNSGSFKGDVARSVLYLEIRYNGLEVVNGFPGITGQLGDLATLLDWHRNDPPDDFEMNRNNIIYTWQFNRNPFIDQPDLVEYIWGTKVGDTWFQSLGIDEENTLDVQVYPNPTSNTIYFKGLLNDAIVEVFSVDGRQLSTNRISSNTSLDLNISKGVYLIKVTLRNRTSVLKIIVK